MMEKVVVVVEVGESDGEVRGGSAGSFDCCIATRVIARHVQRDALQMSFAGHDTDADDDGDDCVMRHDLRGLLQRDENLDDC